MKVKLNLGIEIAPILIVSLAPLFIELTYQINLYLTWEGAYRLYMGEVPYRDFGMPMGFCYWILPSLFFKIFGPSLLTLAKTQAFINIISGLSFRWILVLLGVDFRARLLSILIFTLTYILGFYWPQYNHTVIVFQFLAIGFILNYVKTHNDKNSWISLVAASIFITLSFFTKQDGGGLAFLICLSLLLYHCFKEQSAKPMLITIASLTILFGLLIIPFLKFDFTYWFNYGQAPHNSRIALLDIIRVNMQESRWEKFYLLLILGLGFIRWRQSKIDTTEMLFLILVIGILAEAMIFQVTSYVPRDNNIFFHAFACSYIFYQLQKSQFLSIRFAFPILIILVSIWWSEKYWKYADRIISKIIPFKTDKNIVSINTYILKPEACNYYADLSKWKLSEVSSFKHVKMPESTASGIDRLLVTARKLPGSRTILNMSELTPLSYEAPFTLEKGPLWYHLGVGMFNRELIKLNHKIESNYYDLVIFENIPMLNNFYPFEIRNRLQKYYTLIDSFEAPRTVYPGTIEVYSKK